MRKLQLDVDEIRVESFQLSWDETGGGTVWGHEPSKKDSCDCRPADTAASHANVCCA